MKHPIHSPNSVEASAAEGSLSLRSRFRWCLFGASAWLFASCSGGGGGGAGEGPAGLNEGSYSVNDFNYTDERLPGFHPLGSNGFKAILREELFAIVPTGAGAGGNPELREGPDDAYAATSGIPDLFTGFGEVIHSVSAQLDEDAESELLVLTFEAGTLVNLHRVDRLPSGQYQRELIQGISASTFMISAARVSVGDVDNDFRDEIFVSVRAAEFGLVSNRGEVWALKIHSMGVGRS